MNSALSKTFKKYAFGTKKIEKQKKITTHSWKLRKIWSNFNHSKILNYEMVKVFKEKIPHLSLSSHNT